MRDSLRVIHDAEGVVAIDKPPGLESTGRTPDDPGGVQHHLQARLGRRLWLVHQLDRDTSGVLVFVRKKRLVAEWQATLPRSRKRYLAIVHGVVEAAREVDAPLAYDRAARRWAVHHVGKPARSSVRPLGASGARSLVEVTLHTGRTHQARVHLAHLGHPLLGERRYREPACEAAPRQMLHAWRLEAPELTLEAPPPEDFLHALKRSGLALPLME